MLSSFEKPQLIPSYKLYPHQEGILTFMNSIEIMKTPAVRGGILDVVMGAGKTLVSVYRIIQSENEVPSLVVCPKSVIPVWQADIKKFFGDQVKFLVLHSDYNEKIKDFSRDDILEHDIVITTYETLRSAYDDLGYKFNVSTHLKKRMKPNPKATGKAVLYSLQWPYIFYDESHTALLNPATDTFKAAMCLSSDYAWCLSGTPIKNSSVDLLAQFWICGYTRVDSETKWKNSYLAAMKADDLDKYVLVIKKEDTQIKLPPKRVHTLTIAQTTMERKFYDVLLKRMKSVYEGLGKGNNSFASVLALFTRLRQACIAPHLVTHFSERKTTRNETEEDTDVNELYSEDMRRYLISRKLSGINSSKIQEAIKIIRKVIKAGEKVVVFSSFVCALDLLKDAVEKADPSIIVDQIDGSVTGMKRTSILNEYKTNVDHHVLMISYGTGSVGLNITEANHVLLLEPFYHDVMHDQAYSRVWRNGQTKTVHIHRLITQDSIEGRILGICERKKKMTEELLDDATKLKEIENTKLTKAEIGKLIS